MADYPLLVFATTSDPVPLIALRDALVTEGAPAAFAVDIAGDATDEELRDPNWDAAFLRWLEPDLHDVALIERMTREGDEETVDLIGQHLIKIARLTDVAGRMIVAECLSRTRTVYAVQILPALLEDESHEAWGALDVLLRLLAYGSGGLIYAEAEGYCDADGELMLAETDQDELGDGEGLDRE